MERTLPAGIRITSVSKKDGHLETDYVAVEEPLEIQLDGRPLVITMRTPGHDKELTAGFLYSEGLVNNLGDIQSIKEKPLSPEPDFPDVSSTQNIKGDRILVKLRTSVDPSTIKRAQREFRATAACGVCGKEKLEDLAQELPKINSVTCSRTLLEALPQRLRQKQELFEATGGIHAAGLFTLDGELLSVREDIGRHNAVDKLVGHFLLKNELPLHDRILVVSGRAGFELVQKALKAAIPIMVSVGAASSLAVEMATEAKMSLYSFVAPGRGNLHVRPE